MYTTQLKAGLGLIDETKTLLELWQPGMTARQLQQSALESGRFPNVTARRLRNIVAECFAPRYLNDKGVHAANLKRLITYLPAAELHQLLLLLTCRANTILADFIRQVYWVKYAGGYTELSVDDARSFIVRAIDDGITITRWSEETIRRMASHLTGCCADYGLLENRSKSTRKILPFRISSTATAYLAYDLHFAGLGDNAILSHEDWGVFGLGREDVLDEIKRLALKGMVIVQAAGDLTQISWKFQDMETVCDVIPQI